LFNHGMLCSDDFRIDGDGVYMTEHGAGVVTSAFEEKIASEIMLGRLGSTLPYSRIFLEQARHYRDVVAGTESEYVPFSFK